MFDVLNEYSLISNGRLISTFTACQHPNGGFGAAPGYYAHLATSYASVLSLAMNGDSQALDVVDRKSLSVTTFFF
jgi:protein farnesyltransferase subunit beta